MTLKDLAARRTALADAVREDIQVSGEIWVHVQPALVQAQRDLVEALRGEIATASIDVQRFNLSAHWVLNHVLALLTRCLDTPPQEAGR